MHACTIVARNYLPHARVLARSFLAHNTGSRFTTLVIDDRERQVGSEPFEIMHLDELIADPAELHVLAAYYDVMELATAVKPALLMRLIHQGDSPVVYLDPDIQVYAPLTDVTALAAEAPIVLTPHSTVPFPRDGLRPTEAEILASGVYNLGFIGLSNGCEPFLRWWWERLQRDAIVDPARMLFTDQRWIDFVPGMFDHALLKDPGYNVAYWNVHGRHIVATDSDVRVNGMPLRFFHFSGYSPFRPTMLSKHQGDHPRVRLEDVPALADLCAGYGRRLLEEGLTESGGPAYGWARLPDGTSVDLPMRLAYREGVKRAESLAAGRRALPPDPFDPATTEAFLNWLAAPVPGSGWKSITRYLRALYDARTDLQLAFPESAGDSEQKYVDWARKGTTVPDDRLLEVVVRAPRSAPVADASPGLPAVEAVGYFRAELGVGEAGRQLVAALEAAGAPVTTTTWDETLSRQEHPFEEISSGLHPQVNLLCFNADRMPLFAEVAGEEFLRERYTIGAWAWELADFPDDFAQAFTWVDEIWANSTFTRDAVAARTELPVIAVPPPVTAPPLDPTITKESLGLPDGFVFFFAFDFLSVFERKNPLALIDAFSTAFPPASGASLVIKTINGEYDRAAERSLRAAAARHPDVHLVEGYVTAAERTAMMALSDCYVSLHRSEGFGLTLAESMALGKPVIATGYSGNLDFMDENNSYLVPFELRPVGPNAAPYSAAASWAEPDVGSAARLMRQVFDDPENAAAVGARAARDITTKHSPQARARLVRERLADIGRELAPRAAVEPEPPTPTALALSPMDRRLKRLRFLAHVARTPEMRRAAIRRRAGNVISAGFGQSQRAIAEQEATRREVQTLRRTLDQLAGDLDALARDDRIAEALARAEQAASEARAAADEVSRATALAEQAAAEATATASRTDAAFDEVYRAKAVAEQAAAEATATASRTDAAFDELYRAKALGDHAQERLDELAERLQPLVDEVASLSDELRSAPYVSDPDALRVDGSSGRTLGYSDTSRAPVDYAGFETLFRGEQGFIRERQRAYLPLLHTAAPVLDVGCGRGEMLALLREAHVEARGVDLDPSMVALCKAQELDVELVDALGALDSVAPRSLGAVISFQFIEHLSLDDLRQFFALAHRALQPDGILVAETVNPHSPRALKSFWLDITHRHPIFPEAALLLASTAGFGAAEIFFPHGQGDYERDRVSQGEYALIARRRSTDSEAGAGT